MDSWQDRARCRGMDTDLFFPDGKTGQAAVQAATAKAVCRSCEVREECLDFAIRAKFLYGIFGGLDPEERKYRRLKLVRTG